MSKKLLLAGYFGAGNLGDDAILLGFFRGIDGLDYEAKTICGSVERLMRSYGLFGIQKLDQEAIKNAISECDALVFPGGSIFQDVTSVRSVYYYSNLVAMAKKSGKKVIMLGQGVGPLTRFLGKRMAAKAFNLADVIAVRDAASVSALKALGVRHNPKVTADMAFLLPKPVTKDDTSNFSVAGMKTVGISVRPFGRDKNKGVIKVFGDLVKLLYGAGYVPVMLAMDDTEDRQVIEAIAKAHGGKVPEIKGLNSPVNLQERLMRMDSVIGMRLHSGILAVSAGIPPYMVSYDPKVNAFVNSLGLPAPLSMQGVTAERIFGGFQAFIKDRDRMAASLDHKRTEFAEAAKGNIDLLRTTLGE